MRKILISSVWAALFAAQFVHAGQARDALDNFLDGLVTYQAAFEQSVLDTENAKSGLFHGVFFLNRPNQFRWNYLSPHDQTIIADGRDVWLIEPDLEQAYRKYQPWALKGTPAEVFLAGDKKLDESFEVVEIGERLDMQWLELIPRDKDSDIQRILLAFVENDLARLELSDKFGQISRFTFSRTKRNPVLDDVLFTYDAPPDYDIFLQTDES